MPGRDGYTGTPVPRLEQSAEQLRGAGAVAASSLALALALASLPPSWTDALLDSAAQFTKHFVIGGFSAAVGCAGAAVRALTRTASRLARN